ncbi:2-oxoglutarate and iron-dependent oxygenase JMJD4 homolog [Anopheles ziemanni]|uniref:2-oxoglutarate and iron-dependent oxygenase JMJD4 homolog n=1 Tax=Anopheles coustani TaxID=139045 RepID=UPI002657F283|nr:2-oxoglutarate and iron-dependent oxygenase JMJD4 homolog [Anopheles coustani]XP_058168537.1 2-oxoglutarate and iron-dependent oxygenase JMJD4 homolog [Anopheles ziemanni]
MEEIEIEPPNVSVPISDRYPEEIERISSADLTYAAFFSRYLRPNHPVIITSIANNWECYNKWINRTENTPSTLDVAYLKARLPNVPVPVADCEKQYYNSHEKVELQLHDFLNNWASVEDKETTPTGLRTNRSRYYLKDWHLRSSVPEYCFYQTPPYFASDWLNEYLVEKGIDDYRFVYMGPKGTWTGFHADVFGSYSWSVNVFGQKLWYLLLPGEERKLLDSLNNLPFMITEKLLQEVDVKFYTIRQQPGEAIFVPSGWYHQVLNVEDAISVNHNWFNGCNIGLIWSNLCDALRDVRREIDDCRDMDNFEEHCQLMLKASFGMDFQDFLTIIFYICDKRLASIQRGTKDRQFTTYELGKRHAEFDLKAIQRLLTAIMEGDHLAFSPNLFSNAMNWLNKVKSIEISLQSYDTV